MTETLLELRQIRKCFGDKEALVDLNLRLEPGEITGFIGPNGAGKSTCLRICTGLLQADAGTATVLDLDPKSAGLEIRKNCSYLPGETSLYLQMTGTQFLEFAYHFYPSRNREVESLLREAFDLPLHKKIRSYSAGMKQKLALFASLVPDVDLYLLDEPDRALDASMRLTLREALRLLQHQGKTILLSSHHLSEIDALANRSIFLLNGRVVADAEVDAARQQLQREVRVLLRQGQMLPPGAVTSEELPDGGVRITTEGDPFHWLAQLSAETAESAEVGATRLEDLYRILTRGGTK